MKLKTSIFLWVFLATAVPICSATLYATIYSERLFRESVDREIANSLNNIASEIRRRLLLDRDLLSSLAEVPQVQEFLPVLAQIENGMKPEDFIGRLDRLEEFLADIQAIVSPTSRFQVFDTSGNGLVPRNDDQPPGIAVDAASDMGAVADRAIDREGFRRLVAGLFPGEVRYALNPNREIEPATLDPVPVYDMVLALGDGDRPAGYIIAKIRFQPINRLLNVSPRPHQGQLFIAEIDTEREERNGLVLYDDGAGIELGTERLQPDRLQALHPDIYKLVQRELFGFVDSPDGSTRTYYSEFLPYPDQLLIWVLGIQIDLDELAAPFSRVRVVILGVGLLALLASLVLARIGARKIALPIASLAKRLTDFPRGDRLKPIPIGGPEEIRHAGIAFNEMTSSFERTERERDQARSQMLQKAKLASIGQLAAGIGHEINNPLHNILTLTKLMNRQHPSLDTRLREDIASVHEEAQRASRIVRGLLDFSRETPLEYRRFEVEPWLQETLSLVAQEAAREGARISSEVDDEYLLEGDPDLLQQTLINLIVNGLHAGGAGTLVRVTISMRDENLVIEVDDEGRGIDPNIADRIFDPFFTTKTPREGSGLGLSISLGIVAQHGGELTVKNRLDGGVMAVMILPRAGVA